MIALAASLVLTSCARLFSLKAHSAPRPALFAVTADTTAFYRYSPQQGYGPDRQLAKDTLVTIIRTSFNYSKVRLSDGQQGFVANDDLSRAAQPLIAQATQAPPREELAPLPVTPSVALPRSDSSPEFEPTPIPEPLMPQM